ncbi:MAG: FkbM family methyltransferase [Myxococcota bacterium]|jgi:hypothetical protein|nr:FkbM family methyltransferase [Myxococcota bacterium]
MDAAAHSFRSPRANLRRASGINVRTRPLADLLRDPVDFLKIDVPGAEAEILANAEAEPVNVKQIFVEVHDTGQDFPVHLSSVFELLARAGFETNLVPRVGPGAASTNETQSAFPNSREVFGISGRRRS